MCRPCAGVPDGWRAPFIQCEAQGGKSSHWIAAEKCELGFSCCVLIQCETLPSHWMRPDAQNHTGSVSSRREVARYLQKRASELVIQTLPIRFFHQRCLCDLLPRKKAFHWKPKVGGVCISSQMLNLAFQWTANLSVEKGFGVTAQSLLPAEGAFARKADYPIPQPVQRERQKSLAGSQSCRPSNSPVGTMPKPKHPLRTGGVLVWAEIKLRFEAGKSALRVPFSENRSQKKGARQHTRGADGLTLRVIA